MPGAQTPRSEVLPLNRSTFYNFSSGCLKFCSAPYSSAGALSTATDPYGRQALLLAILPFFVTGLAAIYLAVRHRKAPGSLVSPQRWLMPTALVLGILQTLGFAGLFLTAFLS